MTAQARGCWTAAVSVGPVVRRSWPRPTGVCGPRDARRRERARRRAAAAMRRASSASPQHFSVAEFMAAAVHRSSGYSSLEGWRMCIGLLALPACTLACQPYPSPHAPKWNRNYYRGPPICEPYPGCKAPNATTAICPYPFFGELCRAIAQAKALGMPQNALIVEVGSAFGYGIWTARQAGHPILAFECRKDEYLRLREQFDDDPYVRIVNACVSDKAGTSQLYRAADSSSMIQKEVTGNAQAAAKAAKANGDGKDALSVETVTTVTLDALLGVLDLYDKTVGLIAIDVQGHEPFVLRGAKETIRRHAPMIMYEDTELDNKDRLGCLMAHILAEIGPSAPRYSACHCERDCFCKPQSGENGGAVFLSPHERHRLHGQARRQNGLSNVNDPQASPPAVARGGYNVSL